MTKVLKLVLYFSTFHTKMYVINILLFAGRECGVVRSTNIPSQLPI